MSVSVSQTQLSKGTYGSSTRMETFRRVAKLDRAPDTTPIRAAAGVPTFPAAGVIATKPVIIPVQKPTTDHLRSSRKSIIIQTMPAMLPAKFVLNTAIAARRLAAKVDPPLRDKSYQLMSTGSHGGTHLKPNHPTASKIVPRITCPTLCGL